MKQKKKRKRSKGSALLSSILVLSTCLLYLTFYQQILYDAVESNQMIIEYLRDN